MSEAASESLAEFIDRVERFQIDPGEKVLTFASRLSRENRWSLEFAMRVIREYKRFCILAIRAGHPVTPSEEVDQAWHLHLTYTRSYWERFCGTVLKRPLHHEPTAGGAAEGQKFEDWYAKTLASYQRLFQERPPIDIWPAPAKRFAHAGDWKWYNTARHWLVPRPSAPMVSLAAAAAVLLSLSGCISLLSPENSLNAVLTLAAAAMPQMSAVSIVAFVIHALVSLKVLAYVFRKRRQIDAEDQAKLASLIDSGGMEAISNLTVEDLAVLAGGAKRLTVFSLLRLKALGCVEHTTSRFLTRKVLRVKEGCEQPTAEIDRLLLAQLGKGKLPATLIPVARPEYNAAIVRLQKAWLRYESRLRSKEILGVSLRPLYLWPPLAVFFLNSSLCLIPLAYSVLVVIVSCVANRRTTWLTPAGMRLLRQKRAEASCQDSSDDTEQKIGISSGVEQDRLILQFALAGAAFAMTVPEFRETAEMLRKVIPEAVPASGGGCGADDANAGGCGGVGFGGCGGCAGCGGGSGAGGGCGGGGCGGGGCGGGGCGGGGCGG